MTASLRRLEQLIAAEVELTHRVAELLTSGYKHHEVREELALSDLEFRSCEQRLLGVLAALGLARWQAPEQPAVKEPKRRSRDTGGIKLTPIDESDPCLPT